MSIESKFSQHPSIPDSAECVFSGVRSEVYQWDQELYDGSIKRFERIRFFDGAFTLAITPEWKILITKQEQPAREMPFYSLPWGGFDFPDEDALLCAKRELLEETGYISDEWEHWHNYLGSSNLSTFTYFYIARNVRKIQEIQPDPGEKIEVFEVNFDEWLGLARTHQFTHHLTLLSSMYDALLDKEKHEELRCILFWNKKSS